MAHNVIIKVQTACFNVDALNRSAVYTTGALDNGSVVALNTKSAGIGHWNATLPAEGDAPLWIVATPEVIFEDKTHGGSADPRDFEVVAGRVFDAFCPQVADQIEMTLPYLGTITAGSEPAFLVAGTDGNFATADTAPTSGLGFKFVGTNTLKVGDGAIAPAAIPTYVYECVCNN